MCKFKERLEIIIIIIKITISISLECKTLYPKMDVQRSGPF